MKEIPFTEAKTRFSSVMDAARDGEAMVITRHGKKEAVLVPYEEWARASSSRALWEHLLNAPVDGSELERSPSKMRDFDF